MIDESKKQSITENLRAAGCDEGLIDTFSVEIAAGNPKKAKGMLGEHRKELLDAFHKSKACIDGLDYLSVNLEKEKEL